MHIHGTAFQLSADCSLAEVQQVGNLLAEVGRDTDGVLGVYAGINQHGRAGARGHGIVVAMESTAVQGPYRAHPAHARAAGTLRAVLTDGVGFDTGTMAPGRAARGGPLRVHATLFPELEDDARQELAHVHEQLAEIAADCRSVIATYAGRNESRHPSPYACAVVVVVDDDTGMAEFDGHPLREAVGSALTRLVREPLGLELRADARRL